MKIEILGTGCAKCKRLEENTRKAVEELGIDAEIAKIEDISEISTRGVMMTPALAIDGKTKSKGELLNTEQIKELIQS